MRLKSMLSVYAGILTVALGATCANVAGAQDLQKFSMAVAADSPQYTLAYVAADKGFFTKHGLEIENVTFDSGTNQSNAVISGNAEFGQIGLTHVIAAQSMGGDLVGVTRLFDVLDLYVFLSNEAIEKTGITPDMSVDEKIERMKGLRIGITGPGSTVDRGIRSLFKARGIDPDQDAHLQPLGTPAAMMAALRKGLTDGFGYPAPYPTIAEAQGLGKVVIDPFSDKIAEVQGVPYNVIVSSSATVKKKPELVAKVVRAFADAAEYVKTHPEETKQIAMNHLSKIDPELLKPLMDSYIKGVPTGPVITREQFDTTLKWMNLTADPKLDLSYEQVVVAGPAEQAAKELEAAK